MLYREQRFQPWWILLFALLMTSTLGIAYAAAVSTPVGVIVGSGLSAIAVYAWVRARTDIYVDGGALTVGKMRLDRTFIASVSVLDRAEFLHRIRAGASVADVLSFTSTNSGGVVVELNDPLDPFTAWVIGSKSPQKLAAALTDSTTAV